MTRALIYIILLITTLLSLSSYRYHTAIGIDHDDVQANGILHSYYRINWNGYGSIWIGYGTVLKPIDTKKPLESFDPAAVFFQPVPAKMPSADPQQNDGFGLINTRQPRDMFWLIIPAWLPILLSALIWLLIRHKNHSPSNGTGETTIPSSSEYR